MENSNYVLNLMQNMNLSKEEISNIRTSLYSQMRDSDHPDYNLMLAQKIANWDEAMEIHKVLATRAGKTYNYNLPTAGPVSITQEEKNFLINGKKIDAIKSYRIRTGLGLKEAKDVIDVVQEQVSNERLSTY